MQRNKENVSTKECKAKAEDLFEKLAKVITEEFVATYERKDLALLMRIPNGQTFKITVEEV